MARPAIDPRRVQDEGTFMRPSPEEAFLTRTAHEALKSPAPADSKATREEARRAFGAVRETFRKMKALADALKRTNPERYAKELEALRSEILSQFEVARGLLQEPGGTIGELLDLLKSEGDPVVKERLAFVLRFAPMEAATAALADLAKSSDAADRMAAILTLAEMPSAEGVKTLIERANEDLYPENRERAIVGLGKSISRPGPLVGEATDSAMAAIRSFTHPDHPQGIRAAAWDAFGYPPRLSEADLKLVREAVHQEKDTYVKKAVEGALRRQLARMQEK